MSKENYKIIFEGELVEGRNADDVKQQLVRLFKTDIVQIEQLFNSVPAILKSGLDFSTAAKYEAALRKAGVLCRIKTADVQAAASNNNSLSISPEEPDENINILAAFKGGIKPVPVPLTYKTGLLLVGICMLILPLLYIALIVAAAYMVFYHATESATIFDSYSGFGAVMIYVAPIVIGSILVIFMIKPLFVRQGEQHKSVVLNPQQEKQLFSFVHRICQIVGAPTPKRIDVDCEVNASASFRRGLLSFFGDDLVLTIGLPLVAGFNTRQLAGVLAHEFGHFAQGTGMRLTYVIRSINYWFSQVVYHRDVWDQRLEAWSRGIDIRIGIILYAARFFVWLTRKILWCFMITGHTISCFMLRQMEFDADRYEAQLAGSNQYGTTSMRLRFTAAAAQLAYDDLAMAWDEHRLADDLPQLVSANIGALPTDIESQFKQEVEQGRTGFFDTHPSDKERITNALQQKSAGIFRLEMPAAGLFANFKKLSERVTLHYYQNELGLPVSPDLLVSGEDIEQRKKTLQDHYDALDNLTIGAFDVHHPLVLDIESIHTTNTPEQTLTELKKVRGEMGTIKSETANLADRLNKVDERILSVRGASTLIDAGFKINHKDFSLANGDKDTVERALTKAANEKINVVNLLQEAYNLITKRFHLSFSMLGTQMVYSISMPQQLRIEVESLILSYYPLASINKTLFDFRTLYIAMTALLNNYEGNEDSEALIGKIQEIHKLILDKLHTIQSVLRDTPYLFEHGKGDISMASYIIDAEWDHEDIGMTYGVCETAVDKLSTLHVRLIGRLAFIAQQIEQALGLESIAVQANPPAKRA
ncbi:MAG: hypothetical protein BMS9Abin11_0484 [Gammaproteobacteria bacterium]|nr:MAG: hypothetical protein BMS9Abin11_0484 [Gammaproteobacteria bacterium]